MARPGGKLLLALFLAASMWFYVQHVLIPRQQAEALQHGIPRGNLSDLYPRWLGTRELLVHHRDPYRADVTREIQIGYYGRPLDPNRPNDPHDQQAFAYPVYVAFLLAPTVNLSFDVVQIGFRWLLVVLTVFSVLLWLRTLRWRCSPSTKITVVVLVLGSFPVLQAIKLQQLSLLVAALISVSAWLVLENRFLLAGIVLALAMIKPQLVLLFAVWLLVWAINSWRERKSFVWGFLLTMAVLFAGSEFVLPDWLVRFVYAVRAYRNYNDGAGSILEISLGFSLGRTLAIVILFVLVALAWRVRRAKADSVEFRFMLALVLAVTVLVMPKAAPYNQVLLLVGVLFVLQRWEALWRKGRVSQAILVLAVSLLAWPWVAAAGLLAASAVLPAATVQEAWALPIYTSLEIPVAVLLALVLASPTQNLPSSLQSLGTARYASRVE